MKLHYDTIYVQTTQPATLNMLREGRGGWGGGTGALPCLTHNEPHSTALTADDMPLP